MRRTSLTAKRKKTVKYLFTGKGELYFLHGNCYLPIRDDDEPNDFTITIEDDPNSEYRYSVVVYDEEEEALRQPIGNGLTVKYSTRENSVHWPSFIDGESKLLAFKFAAEGTSQKPEKATAQFVEMYNRCTYALMTESEVETGFADDKGYEYVSSTAATKLPYEDYEEPMYEVDVNQEMVESTGVGNVCYSESMRYDKAVVVRKMGTGIEIQTHAFDNNGWRGDPIKFKLKGCSSCDQALLDDTNKQMLLLSVGDNQLHQTDLEYGKVVEDYTLPTTVRSVTYGAHVAGPAPLYTCLSDNVAFNVDLRMDPRKCVVTDPKSTLDDYRLGSLKKSFTCHATSAEGHLVICDAAGNVRLYTGPPGSRRKDGTYHPKTAKTLLETRVPIVAVDVTADGKYVVAVTSKFLLFMQTAYMTENGHETNGFASRMGERKPQPLRLQPTPAQLAVLGGIDKLDYSSGGFDRYENDSAVCITACSGKYVFTWSLEAAKRAAEMGRACLGEVAGVGRTITGHSASVPGKLTYLTTRDICMAPLKFSKRLEKGVKHYKYA